MRLFESAVWDKINLSKSLRRDALASLFLIISSEALAVQESFATLGSEIIGPLGRDSRRVRHNVWAGETPELRRQATMAITLTAFCLAILTVSILGGLLPLAAVLTHTRLQVYLSFSAGTMLGAAFFHMMPEAVRVGSIATIPWVSFGLLALFFLERFFSFHQHEPHPHEPHTHDPVASSDAHGMTHTPHDPTTICTGSTAARGAATSPAGSALPWGSAAFGLMIHSLVGGVA